MESCAKPGSYMKNETEELVQAWIRKAENDLRNSELVLDTCEENCPYDTVEAFTIANQVKELILKRII